ncbi:serine/threonine-protein kinase 35-like [Corticium candelabrum]|uniref:serine/threonine-protein kinase 35-like n=1 Tax=Corticium candelabrum TaxID=121492 RepID=UPI002E26BAC6|nr:serine/threonine-protein kinase 35-like [Corticium candelabrum]
MAVPLISGASQFGLQIGTDSARGHRYALREKLGSGSFGVVYLARDQTRNIDVAIKLVTITIPAQLQPPDDSRSMAIARLNKGLADAEKEANLLGKLRHPYVIGYLDSYKFQTDELVGVGIVMEYCPGGNLNSYLLRNGRPREELRLQWCRELAEGMEFVHSQGVIHRDLKPDNILIDSDNCLKIADVGVAKAAWDMQENALSGQCATGMHLNQYLSSVVGTAMYIAPEVLSGHYTKACDVFSLGIVFVAIIKAPVTGNILAPYADWQGCLMCYGHLLHSDFLSQRWPPSALLQLSIATDGERHLIDRMLKFYPDDRYIMETVLSTLQRLQDIQRMEALQAHNQYPREVVPANQPYTGTHDKLC